MAHTRIRKFNTKITYPEQNIDNDLCQAVIARGTTVYLRGQIGQNLDTSECVAVGDVAGQTEQAMQNIDMLLKESRQRARSHHKADHLHLRSALSRGRVPGGRSLAEGRVPRLDWHRRHGLRSHRVPG